MDHSSARLCFMRHLSALTPGTQGWIPQGYSLVRPWRADPLLNFGIHNIRERRDSVDPVVERRRFCRCGPVATVDHWARKTA